MQRGLVSLATLPFLLPLPFSAEALFARERLSCRGGGALLQMSDLLAFPPTLQGQGLVHPKPAYSGCRRAPWFWEAVQSCRWVGAGSG